jgi:GTP-binding protein LepA
VTSDTADAVAATIFVPNEYIGQMMTLCARYRGVQEEYKVLDTTDRAVLRYTLPLSEIVTDFFSELKSESSGFASFDYEEKGYEQSALVKVSPRWTTLTSSTCYSTRNPSTR